MNNGDGTYQFVEHPVPVGTDVYDGAIASVAERLRGEPGVRSIFQIGSVSTPGISDVDMVVVFDDAVSYTADPLEEITGAEAYLFTHRLYGAPKSLFDEARPFTFFHNYRLIWGEETADGHDVTSEDEAQQLRLQIALEYLMKMYITLTVAHVFRVIKLRSLFLHVKAVRYDLEFLDATSGPLADLTDRLIGHRSRWFDARLSPQDVLPEVRRFYSELESFLTDQIERNDFYLPSRDEFRLARSIVLEPGAKLAFSHEGVVLPGMLSRLGSAYFSLQHRLNRFRFELPAITDDLPGPIAHHFELAAKLSDYNRRRLPHFAPLTTSLNLL